MCSKPYHHRIEYAVPCRRKIIMRVKKTPSNYIKIDSNID